MFKQFTFLFILIIFHELGHALTGILFKWEVLNITIYPYGGITNFQKLENSSIKEEILILLAGPIFQIIIFLIINNLFTYSYIKIYHYSLLIFNMLPILVLDGGKLLNLFFNSFFNYYLSYFFSIIISFLIIIYLIIFSIYRYPNLNLLLMSIFLLLQILRNIKNIKYRYHKFLLERYLYSFKYKKRKVSKNIYSLYRECNHYIGFQEEKKYLKEHFQNNKNMLK